MISSGGKQKSESLFAKSFVGNDYRRDEGSYTKYRKYNSKSVSNVYVSGVKNYTCMCKGNQNHALQYCPNFRNLSVSERFEYIKLNRLCFKCLSAGCNARSCKAKNCFCGKLHHNMLHFPKENKTVPRDEGQRSDEGQR